MRKRLSPLYLLSLIYVFLSFCCLADGVDKAALIVIDMQPFFVKRGGYDSTTENSKKIEAILKDQVATIDAAKNAKIPIVFIEYECDVCGNTNPVLTEAATGYEKVKYIKKNSDGIFDEDNKYRQDLVKYLMENEIQNLIVTGANGGSCVEESIEGALENNYSVIAISSGIADFNYKEYIYPYKYRDKQFYCKGCAFKQVNNLNEIFPVTSLTKDAAITEKIKTEESPNVDDAGAYCPEKVTTELDQLTLIIDDISSVTPKGRRSVANKAN